MNEIMSLMNRDISGWMCSGDDEAVTAIVFKNLLYKAAIDEQHISFQNASHEMQQSWNDTANQADQTVDSSQNAGMTDEQIDIANDLCGAEDDVDTLYRQYCW